MASELTVQTIRGPLSGANANKILIPSGQRVVSPDIGGLVAPGQVIQVVTTGRFNNNWNTTSQSFAKTNLIGSITPKYSNSLIVVHFTASWLTQGSEMQMQFYRNTTNLTGDNMIHGDYGGNGIYTTHTLSCVDYPNTTTSTEYSIYARSMGAYNVYIYRDQCVTIWEIAQ